MTSDPRPASDPQPYLWWCPVCRRREPFAPTDLDRFGRDGWPVCCGQKVFCASAREQITRREK